MNYKISERINQKYIFYLKINKNEIEKKELDNGNTIKIKDNEDFEKCELLLMDKITISFKKNKK